MKVHSTTILTVRHKGKVAIGGDGQVTLGTAVMKADAMKIRRWPKAKSFAVLPVPAPMRLHCWNGLKRS